MRRLVLARVLLLIDWPVRREKIVFYEEFYSPFMGVQLP